MQGPQPHAQGAPSMPWQTQDQSNWQAHLHGATDSTSQPPAQPTDPACDTLPLSTSPSTGLPPSQTAFAGTEPVRDPSPMPALDDGSVAAKSCRILS